LEQLEQLLPQRTAELKRFRDRQNGRGEPLVGARAFPQSDFVAFHRPTFSFFLKVLSDRTRASETGLNSEHLAGRLQNMGDHYLLRDGLEYLDLAPVWDWQLLPGLTVIGPMPDVLPQPFCGTVTDGRSFATVMDYRFGTAKETQLSAKKFWVGHGDTIVALIADLKGPAGRPICTSLEQCLLRGPVTISHGDDEVTLPADGREERGVAWVQHAGVTYAPIGKARLTVKAGPVEGRWKTVNAALSTELVGKPVFQVVMEHGAETEGGYAILADDSRFASASWKVLRNDARGQAVRFEDGTLAVVFYEPGELESLKAERSSLMLRSGDRVWVENVEKK
jgi:chondroitin AC lyase